MIYSRFSNIFTTFSILLLLSCCDNRDSSISTKIDHIKTIGDTNAILALEMLDSLDTNIRTQSEDVIKKYDMARLRVQDKAYIAATSDIVAKQLVTYFEKMEQPWRNRRHISMREVFIETCKTHHVRSSIFSKH